MDAAYKSSNQTNRKLSGVKIQISTSECSKRIGTILIESNTARLRMLLSRGIQSQIRNHSVHTLEVITMMLMLTCINQKDVSFKRNAIGLIREQNLRDRTYHLFLFLKK